MEAHVTQRWSMGIEARALVILTAFLLAFGLATVYSASAIVEMQAGYGHAHLLVRQLLGMALGIVLFAVAAKLDAEIWEKWAWPVMILSMVLLVIVILPFTPASPPGSTGRAATCSEPRCSRRSWRSSRSSSGRRCW